MSTMFSQLRTPFCNRNCLQADVYTGELTSARGKLAVVIYEQCRSPARMNLNCRGNGLGRIYCSVGLLVNSCSAAPARTGSSSSSSLAPDHAPSTHACTAPLPLRFSLRSSIAASRRAPRPDPDPPLPGPGARLHASTTRARARQRPIPAQPLVVPPSCLLATAHSTCRACSGKRLNNRRARL